GQLHARRARLTASRRRRFERTDTAAEAGRGGKRSGGFEEPAARIRHEMRSGAILVRETLRLKTRSIQVGRVDQVRSRLKRPFIASPVRLGLPTSRSRSPRSLMIALAADGCN